ncbi:MAG: hypothetical protein ACR2MT_16375 [Aurantibacter sp.]
MKLASLALTLGLLLCTVSVQANSETENDHTIVVLSDGILGSWDYNVPGVDPAYQNGIMHVAKEGDNYVVNIELPGGAIPTEDVEVNGNEVKFALYVEGGRVEVTVIFDEDTLTGSGTSDGGPFTLTGSRKAKAE